MNGSSSYEIAVQHLAKLTVGSTVRGTGSRRIDSAIIQDLHVRVRRYPIFVATVHVARDGTRSRSVWELSIHSDGTDYYGLLTDPLYRESVACTVEASIREWLSLRGTSVAPGHVEARQVGHDS